MIGGVDKAYFLCNIQDNNLYLKREIFVFLNVCFTSPPWFWDQLKPGGHSGKNNSYLLTLGTLRSQNSAYGGPKGSWADVD